MKIWFTFLLISLSAIVLAQNGNSEKRNEQGNNIMLAFGPSLYYFQGEYPGSYETYESSRLNVQANGFLGFYSNRSSKKNVFGIFGTAGYTNHSTLLKIIDIQKLNPNTIDSSNFFTFYQVEVGMMAGKILRFSTGYGKQNFKTELSQSSFEYFSSTIGLNIDLGTVAWNIDGNFNYGLDYSKTTLKLSTGLMFMF